MGEDEHMIMSSTVFAILL